MGCHLSPGGLFQQLGGFPWGSWGLNSKMGSPAYSIRPGKEPKWHMAVKSRGFLSTRERWLRCREPLKDQHKIQFANLNPFLMGSLRGRAEWTRDAWEKFGAGGSGERTEGMVARIPVLSHSPYCRSHLSQAENSPPCAMSLRRSNSLAYKNYSAPHCGA